MKKFADRKQGKGKEYKVGDLVLLSTKDLKWQIKGRRLEKLIEHFIGPYKIKRIISSNAVELELPKSIRIHPIVNVSRVRLYKPQVEGQKKIPLKLVIIEGEEEFEVKKILNKRIVQRKEKFLVQWKGYTAEGDTWESRENLENAKELVKEFEREYREEAKELVTNFIRSYLHQFFDDSHGLKASLKPLKKPFDRCQSCLEAINNG